jgi:hypothetical protein
MGNGDMDGSIGPRNTRVDEMDRASRPSADSPDRTVKESAFYKCTIACLVLQVSHRDVERLQKGRTNTGRQGVKYSLFTLLMTIFISTFILPKVFSHRRVQIRGN